MSCRPQPHVTNFTARAADITTQWISPQPQRGTEALAATGSTRGGTRGDSRWGLRHRRAHARLMSTRAARSKQVKSIAVPARVPHSRGPVTNSNDDSSFSQSDHEH